MSEQRAKRVKICVDTSDKPYFYTGIVLKEETGLDGFILIQDERCGCIRLNKSKIISISEVDS